MLFITHNTSIYGAARSLKELLYVYRDVEIDLMVPKYFGASDDDELRQFFGPYVRRIFRQWLPFDPCYRGRPPVLLGFHRHSVIFPFAWALTQGSLYAFVKRQKYDAIHLNSVVLHPLIRPEFPFIIHVREIVDIHLAEVRRGLGQAHGVVFIDQATEAPFRNSPLRRSIILFEHLGMKKVGPKVGISNVDEYVRSFDAFVRDCVGNGRAAA